MATNKTPLRVGDAELVKQFQTGDVVGPEHGGTGKDLTDLSGQAGKYVKVNSGETGYEFDTPAGGGGNGIYGGSGSIPNNTTASIAGKNGKMVFGNAITIGNATGTDENAYIEISQGQDTGSGVGQIGLFTFDTVGAAANFSMSGNSAIFQGYDAEFFANNRIRFESLQTRIVSDDFIISSPNNFAPKYGADYSADIITDDRKIPDMGVLKTFSGVGVSVTDTTDSNGVISPNHPLGYTPTVVVATYQGDNPYFATITGKDDNRVYIKIWDSATGSPVTSTGVEVSFRVN